MVEPKLPEGHTRVSADEIGVEAAAAFFVEGLRRQMGRPVLTEDDYINYWEAPTFDPATDLVIVSGADGAMVAQEVVANREPFVDATVIGVVDPGHSGLGLGSALLGWAEARALEAAQQAPADARVAIQIPVDPGHAPSVELLENHGAALARSYFTMAVDFDGAPVQPPLADGLAVRPFAADDLDAAVAAAADAFADHYGYVARPHEARRAEFEHWTSHPDFDPTLLWHVYDGREIVANCWCSPKHEGDPAVGYVNSLAVRRGWRGRGVAKFLLGHAFAEFHRRGAAGVALDVDADSLTGATRLYESVGMTVRHRNAMFEKEVRPGRDLARREL